VKPAGRNPKLSESDVQRVMELRAQNLTFKVIAERFGVSETVVYYALKRANAKKLEAQR
jgi:transposase